MAKSPVAKRYQEPAEVRIIVHGANLAVPGDWEYLPFTVVETAVSKKLFKTATPRTFFVDITPLTSDEKQDWIVELRPSQFIFDKEPVGTRGVSVSIAEFSQSLPKDQWDNDFGNFQKWMSTIQEINFPACDLDETNVPISRFKLRFVDYAVPAGHFALLAILARQTSDDALEVVSGEVLLSITTQLK